MLSVIVFLPLLGAIAVLLAGGRRDRHARHHPDPNATLGRDGDVTRDRDTVVRVLALGVSLATFAATLLLWWRFDPASADYQFVEKHSWIPWTFSAHSPSTTNPRWLTLE